MKTMNSSLIMIKIIKKALLINPMLSINSPLFVILQVSHYMSQVHQSSDCYLFDIEPNFSAIPFQACYRKPSYDDILCELLGKTSTDIIEAPFVETITTNSKQVNIHLPVAKKQKKKREYTKALVQGQQRGHWKIEENKRYHWFLEIHSSHFLNKHLRRMDKIFKSMEKFVGTREAEQCRSHHQKMEKKHGSFKNILKELRIQLYGVIDTQIILSQMKLNGVEYNEQLLNLSYLQKDSSVSIVYEDNQKLTDLEVSPKDSFIEAIAELNNQFEAGLQLLIL